MTQYLLSVHPDYSAPAPDPTVMEQTYRDVDAFNDELRQSGAWVFAGGLHPPESATVVRVRDGDVVTTDGPYAETKEHLGGFTIVDLPDDAAARYWAGRLAIAFDWPQEVHRFPSGVVEIIERQSQESE